MDKFTDKKSVKLQFYSVLMAFGGCGFVNGKQEEESGKLNFPWREVLLKKACFPA